jgi:hypothetical protein
MGSTLHQKDLFPTLVHQKASKTTLSNKAGVTFDNSFFDNYFDFVRQLKNGSFLGSVFVHVTG